MHVRRRTSAGYIGSCAGDCDRWIYTTTFSTPIVGQTRTPNRDSQLENNVTKALINTLRLGGGAVSRPFLAWLGIAGTTGTEFLLQRHDLPSGHAAHKRCRMLLGISERKSVWSASECEGKTYDSVPDAWVYGDGFAVLVESKVGDNDFSPNHMQAHLAHLGPTERLPPKIVLRTWRDVHGFFNNLLPNLADASSLLLVGQFIQFLEYNDMSGFSGFQCDHFDYFLMHDDDDARRWVWGQMNEFAARADRIAQGRLVLRKLLRR